MAEGAGALGSAPASGYPEPAVADLCVAMLATLPGNDFDVVTALGGPMRTDTRSAATDTPCCVVHSTAVVDGDFYFGRERNGYILVLPADGCPPVPRWPIARDGRLLPLRLTRWLTAAPSDSVCRHACDEPRCVRLSHLVLGDQADNLADCRRRKRRPPLPQPLESLGSTARSPATTATDRHHQSTARASPSVPQSGSEGSNLVSPSKAARKRARAALAAARAADGGAPPANLSRALSEAQGPRADAEG